jgi:thiol-disulfide isomerase/thioredoxin
MRPKTYIHILILTLILSSVVLTACGSSASTLTPESGTDAPAWFDIDLTDVQTGEIFNINDYAGKVVLVETMAMWCPNCLFQASEVRKMHKLLDNPDDVISISLDVDVHEDDATLKGYTEEYGFGWHFAVAPLEVARALGNLYSAEYLNPPLSPMLIIDKNGGVHQLEYGHKSAESLQKSIEPFLKP